MRFFSPMRKAFWLFALIFLPVFAAPPGARAELNDGTTASQQASVSADASIMLPLQTLLSNQPVSSVSSSNSDLSSTSKSKALDDSVLTALNRMGLSERNLVEWSGSIPHSTLRYLWTMPKEKQRDVAQIALYIRAKNRNVDAKTAWREASALVHYCDAYSIPTHVAVGIAHTESRFNPQARSRSGALGVMQVMWRVHNDMLQAKGIASKKGDMFDPEKGIAAGCLLLARYIHTYGSVTTAINRYCGGFAKAYLRTVNRNMASLQRHFATSGI